MSSSKRAASKTFRNWSAGHSLPSAVLHRGAKILIPPLSPDAFPLPASRSVSTFPDREASRGNLHIAATPENPCIAQPPNAPLGEHAELRSRPAGLTPFRWPFSAPKMTISSPESHHFRAENGHTERRCRVGILTTSVGRLKGRSENALFIRLNRALGAAKSVLTILPRAQERGAEGNPASIRRKGD